LVGHDTPGYGRRIFDFGNQLGLRQQANMKDLVATVGLPSPVLWLLTVGLLAISQCW
jgi:hypothetical protein